MVRSVGMQLYFCDEDGRFMYNAAFLGTRLFYVPEPDVQRVTRRVGWIVFAAFAIASVALGGAVLDRSSAGWYVLAAVAAVMSPAVGLSTFGDRFRRVDSPDVIRAVREHIVLQHEGALGSALMSAVCCGWYGVEWAIRHPAPKAFLLLAVTLSVLLAPALYWARERKLLRRDPRVAQP